MTIENPDLINGRSGGRPGRFKLIKTDDEIALEDIIDEAKRLALNPKDPRVRKSLRGLAMRDVGRDEVTAANIKLDASIDSTRVKKEDLG